MRYNNLKFSQQKERNIYGIALSISHVELSIEDESKLARLLLKGSIGSDLYDIVSNILVGNKHLDYKSIEYLFGKLYDFKYKYTEMEYLRVIDSVFVRTNVSYSSELSTVYSRVIQLIDSFYGDGIIDYIDFKNNKSYRKEVLPGSFATLLDLEAFYLGAIVIDKNKKIQGNGFTGLTRSMYTIAKECVAIKDIVDEIKTLDPNKILEHFNNSCNSSGVRSIEGHYRISSSYYPEYKAANIYWEREDFTKELDDTGYLYRMFFDYLDRDILTKRKVILREKGVIVRPIKAQYLYDNVEEIFLKEEHDIDNKIHNIIIEYITDDGVSRGLVLDILNFNKSGINFIYGLDVVSIVLVLKAIGLLDDEYLIENFQKNVDKHIKSKEDRLEIMKGFNFSISKMREIYSDDFIYYEEPNSWNYSVKGAYVTRFLSKGQPIGQRIVEVGNYTRTLPAGHKASDDAKELARLYKIDLGKERTFVKSFSKKIDIRLNNKE